MAEGEWSEIAANLASRNLKKAEESAAKLGLTNTYGSVARAFGADGEIEAIYNRWPNSLCMCPCHQSGEAGKHVLCRRKADHLTVAERKLLLVKPRGERCGVKDSSKRFNG